MDRWTGQDRQHGQTTDGVLLRDGFVTPTLFSTFLYNHLALLPPSKTLSSTFLSPHNSDDSDGIDEDGRAD